MGKKRKIGWSILLLFLTGLAFVWALPFLRIVFFSFSTIEKNGKMRAGFSQYRSILLETPVYLDMYWNSVLLTMTVVVGSIVISLLGAYAFTMLKFRGKELLYFCYIVVMLLPLQVTMMPNYMIACLLHMENSWFAVILPAVWNPFGVFLLRQQMRKVPPECIEAARMDGAGQLQIFCYIFLPMVRSGIMALGMLVVIEYWNIVDQVVIFIRQPEKYPLSIFLNQISRERGEVSYAATSFYLIPVMALMLYGHDYLKEGIGLMNVKE